MPEGGDVGDVQCRDELQPAISVRPLVRKMRCSIVIFVVASIDAEKIFVNLFVLQVITGRAGFWLTGRVAIVRATMEEISDGDNSYMAPVHARSAEDQTPPTPSTGSALPPDPTAYPLRNGTSRTTQATMKYSNCGVLTPHPRRR